MLDPAKNKVFELVFLQNNFDKMQIKILPAPQIPLLNTKTTF